MCSEQSNRQEAWNQIAATQNCYPFTQPGVKGFDGYPSVQGPLPVGTVLMFEDAQCCAQP